MWSGLGNLPPRESSGLMVSRCMILLYAKSRCVSFIEEKGSYSIRLARSGNRYIMIAYHCDANLILAEPFSSIKDTHRLLAYNKIMQRLTKNKLSVDLQILDNEASAEYKRAIKTKWNANYQLVPHNTHRSNVYERAIRTFKAHFLSSLAGVATDFPRNLWNLLISQTELTLKLLRQATLDPTRYAWSYFHSPFNYDATPIGPLGCDIIAHKKIGT